MLHPLLPSSCLISCTPHSLLPSSSPALLPPPLLPNPSSLMPSSPPFLIPHSLLFSYPLPHSLLPPSPLLPALLPSFPSPLIASSPNLPSCPHPSSPPSFLPSNLLPSSVIPSSIIPSSPPPLLPHLLIPSSPPSLIPYPPIPIAGTNQAGCVLALWHSSDGDCWPSFWSQNPVMVSARARGLWGSSQWGGLTRKE